jgi:hypothetical protein
MDVQTISGVLGVVCLGLASLAAFLMVPARELTARERLGIHTFYWSFAIYSAWTIYLLSYDQGWERYFYVCIPLMLGLVLSLMSEFQSKEPPINITDQRIRKLTTSTWHRLPNNVKKALQSAIMSIQEVPGWSDLDEAYHQNAAGRAVKWFCILPLPARGIIHLSHNDCKSVQDDVIRGALAHEFALAYQSTRTPFDSLSIEKAGSQLPLKWKYIKETAALQAMK